MNNSDIFKNPNLKEPGKGLTNEDCRLFTIQPLGGDWEIVGQIPGRTPGNLAGAGLLYGHAYFINYHKSKGYYVTWMKTGFTYKLRVQYKAKL